MKKKYIYTSDGIYAKYSFNMKILYHIIQYFAIKWKIDRYTKFE